MDLFGSREAEADTDDALFSAFRSRGGTTWWRMVTAVDEAIGALRASGVRPEDLSRIGARTGGVVGGRARLLASAVERLDARLASAGALDERRTGALLADALRAQSADEIADAVGCDRVRARWLFAWESVDLAWWRLLDDALSRRGGWARVQLPAFDRPLESARETDPLEALAEDLSGRLDSAPETEVISPVLGDLTGAPPAVPDPRVTIVRGADASSQARAAATAVSAALAAGARVERVVIALPTADEATLGPLRRALDAAGVVAFESRGALPSTAPVVDAALRALDAAESFDRHAVAALLRSSYVDPARLADREPRAAERAVARAARALEASATAPGDDPALRLVRTAVLGGAEEEIVARVAALLSDAVRDVRSRTERSRSARQLWSALGIASRAGRGALATFGRDEPPTGVARAERLAVARDARAWDALVSALDAYERTAARFVAGDEAIDATTFRLELLDVLDAHASAPAAARAGAVRIARLVDVAGAELDLLVVLDANEGLLPRDDTRDGLVSDALWDALARTSRGTLSVPNVRRSGRDLAALAVAAAESRAVTLAFVSEDASGAPLEPSSIVDAVRRAGTPVRAAREEPSPAPDERALFRAAREREREAFFLDPSRPRGEIVGDLPASPEVHAVVSGETGGGDRALAVTGLERFARCPFMGYAHVVLGARDAELRRELPDAREEGTLVHEALAAAFRATVTFWPRRPRDAESILRVGLSAVDDVLQRWQGHAPLRAVVRLRVRDAVQGLLREALEDDAWNFVLAEQSFGARGGDHPEAWPAYGVPRSNEAGVVTRGSVAADTAPAFAVARGEREPEPLGAGDHAPTSLRLRGTIDRVDLARDGSAVRVIDYKRSKTTVRAAASALGDSAIQVPLYAVVVAERFGLPATGAYVPTQPRDIGQEPSARARARVEELARRDAGEALAPIERRGLELVSAARAGRFAPVPSSESECRQCAVSSGCRKPRFAMAPADDADEGG
jgi:RecB family exonuclease